MLQWQFILLVLCCSVILGDLLIHVVYAFAGLSFFDGPPEFRVLPPPEDSAPTESVTFPTSDGLNLQGGVYLPAEDRAVGVVVFCPEMDAPYQTVLNYAPALLDAGFAVFAFDFRNQGASERQPAYRAKHWLSEYEVEDVHSAIDFISSQPQFSDLPIGLFGVSRGACAALAAGATRPDVKVILAQGPFSTHQMAMYYSLKWLGFFVGRWRRFIPNWHVRVTLWWMRQLSQFRNGSRYVRLEALLPKLRSRDLLIVSGGRDSYVPEHVPRKICELTGHAPEDCHWIVRSAKHNMERQVARQEFDDRALELFSRMLATPVAGDRVPQAMVR